MKTRYYIEDQLVAETEGFVPSAFQTAYFCAATGRIWARIEREGLQWRAQLSTAPDCLKPSVWPPGVLSMGYIPPEWPLAFLQWHIAHYANALLKGTPYYADPNTLRLQCAPDGAFRLG